MHTGLTSAILAFGLVAAAAVTATGVQPITLINAKGMQAHILPIGATVQRLIVPGQDGVAEDVVLGYDDPNVYQVDSCAIIHAFELGFSHTL